MEKLTERIVKLFDKETKKLKNLVAIEKVHEASGQDEDWTYIMAPHRIYRFRDMFQRDRELDEHAISIAVSSFNKKRPTKVELPVPELYKMFQVIAKISNQCYVAIFPDRVEIEPTDFKKSVDEDAFLRATYFHDFGIKYSFKANPQYIVDGLIPGFVNKEKSVTLELPEKFNDPFVIVSQDHEALFLGMRGLAKK